MKVKEIQPPKVGIFYFGTYLSHNLLSSFFNFGQKACLPSAQAGA